MLKEVKGMEKIYRVKKVYFNRRENYEYKGIN